MNVQRKIRFATTAWLALAACGEDSGDSVACQITMSGVRVCTEADTGDPAVAGMQCEQGGGTPLDSCPRESLAAVCDYGSGVRSYVYGSISQWVATSLCPSGKLMWQGSGTKAPGDEDPPELEGPNLNGGRTSRDAGATDAGATGDASTGRDASTPRDANVGSGYNPSRACSISWNNRNANGRALVTRRSVGSYYSLKSDADPNLTISFNVVSVVDEHVGTFTSATLGAMENWSASFLGASSYNFLGGSNFPDSSFSMQVTGFADTSTLGTKYFTGTVDLVLPAAAGRSDPPMAVHVDCP